MKSSSLLEKRILMDPATVALTIGELTDELGRWSANKRICLVGIYTGGVHIAHRIRDGLAKLGFDDVPMGVLDITLYRDDTFLSAQQPEVRTTDIPFEINGMDVILVDDVIFTGRTIRAALNALADFGRPNAVKLVALVDRGLRELPIQPDLCGHVLRTSPSENVQVELTEMGYDIDRVVVYEAKH